MPPPHRVPPRNSARPINYTARRSGTNRIYVGNRTAPAIKAGTQLQITLWTYKNGKHVKTVTAPREMTGIFGANYEFADTIRMCEARVTLPRDIGIMTKRTG